MRRWVVLICQLAVVTVGLVWLAACGGKSTPKTSGPGIPASVTLSPATATVTRGQTLLFSATVLDSNGSPVTSQTISFHSSNTSVLQISSGGLGCAGTWDSLTTPVVCTPGPIGNTTVTAVSGTLSSSPSTVAVHEKVVSVSVSPSNPACLSSGHTLPFTAHAFDANGQDITSTVGTFVWNSNQGQVVSLDATGTATAAAPGVAGIFASVNGVNSPPISFSTCPVLSIALHTNDAKTAFAVDNNGTQQLQADVIDTNGLPLANAGNYLTFNIINRAVGSASGGSEVFTAATPGTTPIVASCSPPACNIGMTPVYSNVVTATVNGNNTTTVYTASTTGTSLVPIDTATNTAGNAITLPQTPNSLLLSSDGNRGYLGSSNGLMFFDIASASVGTLTGVNGKAIAVSRDGSRVIVFDSDKNLLYVVSATNGASVSFPATGVTAAAFSPDAYKAFIVGGSTLYTYSPVVAFRTDSLQAPATDVAFLNAGALGFLAGGVPSAAVARFTCNNQTAAIVSLPEPPLRIAPLTDGSGMLLVGSSTVDIVKASLTSTNTPCPPLATASLTQTASLGGAFKTRQLLVTPDGTKAFIISDAAAVLAYNIANNSTSVIPLSKGVVPTTAGLTLDSTQLWVGGSDNAVHLVDIKSGADIKAVSVGFSPDLVAVRPH
jgi:trimeric autotransporter adhesin